MPKIRMTDSEVRKLPHGPTAWYSEERPNMHAGLRLCVGRSAKTWYASKRDPRTGKVLSVKLGRFPALSSTAAWERCSATASRIDNGQAEAEALPTFREMLDRYIKRQVREGDLAATTAEEYRRLARNHLGTWLDKPLDQIKPMELTDHLEALKAARPYAATKAAVIVGAVFKLADKFNLDVRSPVRTFKLAKMKQRAINTTIPWSVRLAEIEAVENPVKRAAWLLLWHTGIRSGNLRALTWADVDLEKKQVRLAKMKNGLARTLPLSDVSVELFKRLVGLDPRLVFPGRGRVPLDQLDRLPSMSQHHLRHLWVDAAAACHLPSYVIAFLKGDVVKADGQDMVAHYMHDLGDGAAPNAISAKILEKCGTR
jgi:integrase